MGEGERDSIPHLKCVFKNRNLLLLPDVKEKTSCATLDHSSFFFFEFLNKRIGKANTLSFIPIQAYLMYKEL